MVRFSQLRSINPFDPLRTNSLVEAVWSYLVFVVCITFLSVVTGTVGALFMGSGNAILTLRLLNGLITAALGFRIINAKHLRHTHWFKLLPVAALLSAAGYEIIGLGIVAYLSTLSPRVAKD